MRRTRAKRYNRAVAENRDAVETVLQRLTPDSPALAGRLFEGAKLGRYVVLGLVGKGGMGQVYRGYDPKLRREVAIKVLGNEGGEAAVARLVREAQAMAQLSHPNVVPVYDVEEQGGRVFLAMELVIGETLRSWLEDEHTPEARLDVLIQAGRGLAAAHAVDLVHRDFKPANVMVGEDGRARVMDFGIARGTAESEIPIEATRNTSPDELERSQDSLSAPLTRAGTVLGTPAYMAPEQHLGGPVDHRSDQFAFCVALYEALAGKRPFRVSRSADWCRVKVEKTPEPLEGVPRHLQRAVAKGLSVSPYDRFESMDALLAQLERNPRMNARRLTIAAGVGLILAGGYGWSRWSEFERAEACKAEAAKIGEVWNESTQDRVARAVKASGKAYAPTTADSAVSLLEERATEWSDATETACHRANVEESWDQDLFSRAQWCLNVRRGDIAALIERLEEAEPIDVETAVERAASLASVQLCLDERVLAGFEIPAAHNRDALQRTSDKLARARALVAAKKADAGLGLAQDALAVAQELESGAVAARAHLTIAEARDALGEFADGTSSRKAAYFAAMDAGSPHVAGAAASGLIFSTGVNLSHEEEARDWHRHAHVALRQAGLEDDGLAFAHADMNLGTVEFNAANVPIATALFEKTLAVHEAKLGASHPQVATLLNMLASSVARSGAFAKARPLFERALEIQRAAHGGDHPKVATTLHNIATGLHVEGDYEAAAKLYEQSLAIRERSLRADHPDIGLSLNNLAGIAWELGDRRKSLELSQRALSILESQYGLDHPRVANSLTGVAGTHVALGESDKAIPLLQRAVAIYDAHPRGAKSNEPTARFELAKALVATGGDLRQAREQAEKARVLYLERGDEGKANVAKIEVLLAGLDE